MKLIHCWIEHPVRSLDTTFTYICEKPVSPGCRVSVPFGSQLLVGFVESVEETSETKEQVEKKQGFALKEVISTLDEESLITDELRELALWLKETTLSTTISCYQAMLPAKIRPSSSGDRKVVMERWVRVSEKEVSLTPRQLEAYLYLVEKGPMRYSDLRKKFGVHAKALIDKGALVEEAREKEAAQGDEYVLDAPFPLTKTQQQAMKEIVESNDPVYLIFGVTGSGKTEIYLRLAAAALGQGKQVLFLVPEIALTPQMINRVSSRFGNNLAMYHSGLSPQEKYEQYRKVKSGRASVVVGTRSAVFLPFRDLGLIVMDEEHDPSYKQDRQPCYHCRDVAIWRGRYHSCKVILGSATPSLESYARAYKKAYHLVNMDTRVNHAMPVVEIVSMREQIRKSGSYILSDVLKEKIGQRLKAGKQSILLLNRRGYTAMLRCRSCTKPLICPHCDLAMSWHRDENILKCHACGYEMKLPHVCPECRSEQGFSYYGFGTQRLEEELHTVFPSARLLRMDADSTARKNGHKSILEAFGKHEADILFGTQMIAKGLDYPDVTLVGVVNGDNGLSRQDYRSCEATFDLLTQASGRSGRADEPGEVVLQVLDPDHYAVQCAAKGDYVSFFEQEMHFRHAGQYPPYVYIISLTVSGRNAINVDRLANALKNGVVGGFKTIGVIGLLKIKDNYRSRVLLKGKDLDAMRRSVKVFMDSTDLSLDGLVIDVNPMYLE